MFASFDRFTLMLVTTVALASVLPASGMAARWLDRATTGFIALLFFLHGAKLSRQAILAGAGHWRLHLGVFSFTFLAFPLMGWGLRPLLEPLCGPALYRGVLYCCALPATVQSAIAFTSVARGNVPAAVCSASASSLLGIVVTPLMAGLLLGGFHAPGAQAGEVPGLSASAFLHAVGKITVQLLVPFVAGHLARHWIGGWIDMHKAVLKPVDQGSILLVVYAAFSAAVLEGLWRTVPWPALAGLLGVCAVLLTLALLGTRTLARLLGFTVEDEITTVFCGSKKSLATGVPMARVLFPAAQAGPILLPLMLFHQMQLMVCAVLAARYARRREGPDAESGAGPNSGPGPGDAGVSA